MHKMPLIRLAASLLATFSPLRGEKENAERSVA